VDTTTAAGIGKDSATAARMASTTMRTRAAITTVATGGADGRHPLLRSNEPY
jgi:hypothetical protein